MLECVSSRIQFKGQKYSSGEVKLVAYTVHKVQ